MTTFTFCLIFWLQVGAFPKSVWFLHFTLLTAIAKTDNKNLWRCRGTIWCTIATDLEWDWRSLLLFETFVIPITQEIWRGLTTVCLHIHVSWKVHVACDLNFIVNDEGLLRVTGSHIHRKSGDISELETLLDNKRPLTGSDTRIWHI